MQPKTISRLALGAILAAAAAGQAWADELPTFKAGQWETKASVQVSGMPSGPRTIEQGNHMCVDQATAKELRDMMLGVTSCKQDVKKTATGYIIDSVCTSSLTGTATTSHTEITGDFNSGYTWKSTSRSERSGRQAHDSNVTGSAKYLGACPAGWKPGDVETANGHRMNIKDAAK